MTPEDIAQRALFSSLQQYFPTDPTAPSRMLNELLLEIDCMCAFQIEVPLTLEPYLKKVMEIHGIDPQYNHIHASSQAGSVILSLDHTIDNNQWEMQLALISAQIPMTIYLNNDDDLWKRSEFRWIDGEYKTLYVDHSSATVEAFTVLNLLEVGALQELKQLAEQQCIRTNPVPFYREDTDFCKPIALRAICEAV